MRHFGRTNFRGEMETQTATKTYYDLEEDGGSRVLAQIRSKKAELDRRLATVRHLIAFGSGKGGVGKSTLAMQIGAALRAGGHRVSLLDADINGPSLARLAGLAKSPLIPGRDGLVPPRTKSGIGVLSFGTIVPEEQNVEFPSVSKGDAYTWRATKEITTLTDFLVGTDWGELDFLLVDLPPGSERSRDFAELFGSRLKVVFLTVPSQVSQGVVLRSIAAVRKTRAGILGYVENMSGYYCADCGGTKALFPKGSIHMGIPLLGTVPFDPELARCCDEGKTIDTIPDSPVAGSIFAVARAILSKLEAD